MSKAMAEIGGAVFGLLGGIVGAYGTYLLTRWSLPFAFWGIMGRMWEIFWKLVTFRKDELIEELKFEANFSAFLNEDNKAVSLLGAYVVFVGFALQIIGALLAVAAVVHG